MTASAHTKLRRTLSQLGAERKIYKNILIKIAVCDVAMLAVDSMEIGSVAITSLQDHLQPGHL